MAAKEWASLLTGLVLAGVGLAALAASGPGEVAAVPAAPPVTAAPALVPVPVTTPAADLPAAVAAVLAGNGPLELIDPGAYGIPAEVARVLAERGVILTVTVDSTAVPIAGKGR
jgi:hypothetical protein